MSKTMLDAGRFCIVEHDDEYDVQVSSSGIVRNFRINKLGYNVLIENLRVALDLIEHVENRR
jgi:hypothetical protein